MQPIYIVAIALLYLLMLFGVARFGDINRQSTGIRSRTTIYPLSLAIYCTSWTFFGSVGLAASSGISFLAIYIGPVLVMTFGFPILKKVVSLSKGQRITSAPDFLASRYGKSVRVAAVATIISVVGTVPYIALQLKAVSLSLSQLIAPGDLAFSADIPIFGDISLLIVIGLAVFSILFGTRHADATEHQYGLMLAIALESAIKLAAFLMVGFFVTYVMFDGIGDLYTKAASNAAVQSIVARGVDGGNMIVLTALSTLAFLLLPRQFHVTVVENHSEKELSRARWQFPIYLVLINLFVLPIAAAGILTFGTGTNADGFVLALPQAAGSDTVSLIAFVGGLSAGTAMVIVACVALAIMISNHLVLPIYLRGEGYDIRHDHTDMEQRILNIRRTAITVILLLAFAYYKAADNTQALASIGLVSFAAVAQLAPAFFVGLFWRGANARGAITGMVFGFGIWAYALLIPTLVPDGQIMGMQLLSTANLFNLDMSPLASGVLWSLAFNTAGLVLGSMTRRASPLEDHQATVFVAYRPGETMDPSSRSGYVTVGQIKTTLQRYLGDARAKRSFDRYWQEAGHKVATDEPASVDLIRFSEDTLASAIGSSSSRLVHSLLLQRYDETSSANLQLLDQASDAIQYNQSVLQTALDQLDQGITVFDADMRLSFWNRQFRKLLNLPASLGEAGTPLSEIAEVIANKHRMSPEDRSFDNLEQRIASSGAAWGLALPRIERILEIRSSPMPGGGMVIAWHDVTERMQSAEALREANETLEKRVAERTGDLVRANQNLELATRAADIANQSKTRFLAAAGHDLLQPLNAARLYTSTLLEAETGELPSRLGKNISRSLESVEEILGSVLAISRLDSATHKINISNCSMQKILEQVDLEFRPMADERKLKLVIVPSTLWVRSDPSYLRRLLQNLVSNAIKYTNSGTILVGCRRNGTTVKVSVIDTGVGIANDFHKTIFSEFERLEEGARLAPGLGLGLSIVERISQLLNHPVEFASIPGKGTHFSVSIQRASASRIWVEKNQQAAGRRGTNLTGLSVLCIDNDASILEGMEGLLHQWGCVVVLGLNSTAAIEGAKLAAVESGFRPAVCLVDFHLDFENGLEAIAKLQKIFGASLPCILVTADRSADLKKAAEAKSVLILNKPVKPGALRAILSQVASQREAAE